MKTCDQCGIEIPLGIGELCEVCEVDMKEIPRNVQYDVRWHDKSSALIGNYVHDDREEALALAYQRLQLHSVSKVVIWIASKQWLILSKKFDNDDDIVRSLGSVLLEREALSRSTNSLQKENDSLRIEVERLEAKLKKPLSIASDLKQIRITLENIEARLPDPLNALNALSRERLREKIMADPDLPCEAGGPITCEWTPVRPWSDQHKTACGKMIWRCDEHNGVCPSCDKPIAFNALVDLKSALADLIELHEDEPDRPAVAHARKVLGRV